MRPHPASAQGQRTKPLARNEHHYTDLLETLVRDIEVFNFGLPGSGTNRQHLIFETFARDLEADLVIFWVLVENIRRNISRYRPYLDDSGETVLYAKPYYTLDYDGLKPHNQPIPRNPLAIEELAPEERPYVDLVGNALMVHQLANRLGITDMLLRYSNSKPVRDYDAPTHQHAGYPAHFAELAAASGTYLCDPLDEMRNRPEEEREDFRFRTDPHFSSAKALGSGGTVI